MRKTLLLLLLLSLAIALPATELLDRIVAKVGSEIILMSDIQKQMLQMQASGLPKESINPSDVIQELIEQRLILQKAKELDIKLNEDAIRKYADGYIKQIKDRYPSEEEFKKELAASQITENELLEFYVEMLRDNALTEQLVERFVTSKAVVTETEMLSFYEAHKDSLAVKPVTWETGMILRNVVASKEAIQARLDEIRAIQQRVMNGEDFATLAAETSDCPSKARGGDLGFFSKGMMVKPFEDAAFKLSVGEYSDVVRSEFGFHLIKVEEKRGEEIRARHILKIIQPTLQDSLDASATMESVRERLLNGAPFGELAAVYSEDLESVDEGGIIGEFDENGMPELFKNVIMATPVGQPTQVLENEGMFYIFMRLKELPQRLYSYDEVKDEVGLILSRQKQMQAYEEWIATLAKESWVQVLQ
ncbi:MAG TPA: peptidylprolyl isomerase [Candidatus Cloacimonadota bacterium]|nr:peptidylprolyl isomerase [Candidatus Cloacimonadota bacterium]